MEEEKTKQKKESHNLFLIILLAGCVITIITSFYFFYFKKDYVFFVEIKCDPQVEACFYRDCENNPDICPPNNLSYYSQYTLSAKDFAKCANEDCTEACATKLIKCEKVNCSESDLQNGTCVLPTKVLN